MKTMCRMTCQFEKNRPSAFIINYYGNSKLGEHGSGTCGIFEFEAEHHEGGSEEQRNYISNSSRAPICMSLLEVF